MSKKLFLFISDHFVTVYGCYKGIFGGGVQFERNAVGLKEFSGYLDQNPIDGAVYLLVDVTEETLREEIVPKLFGPNRQQMLVRRAARIFRDSPYHYGRLQGKVPGEKKEWALFIGLNDPQIIVPWLTLLGERHVPVAGIWSLTLLCQEMFKFIPSTHEDTILITVSSGGLRQVFLRDKRILVSRLTNLPSRDSENILIFIHREVARMQGYLASLRLTGHNATLNVFTLGHAELYQWMQANREDVSTYVSHPVNAEVFAKSQGLHGQMTAANVDVLIGQFLLKHRIHDHYARPEETRIYRTVRLGRWLRLASPFVLLAGMVVGGSGVLQGLVISSELPTLALQADAAQVTLQKLAKAGFEKTGGGKDMVTAVKTIEAIREHAVDPQIALTTISWTVLQHADIWMDGMDWYASDQGNAVVASGKKDRPERRIQGGQPSPRPRLGVQTVILRGRVLPFPGSVAGAQDKVTAFINALRSLSGVLAVVAVSMPMDINQTVVLDSTQAANVQQSNFVLSVTLQLEAKKDG